ncbi:hypothetical protein BDZ45DRAFT_301718 [Acephala macrosclerotiorum]|nr:hypothetical protein BDZ45DRAFT_301718 [Acephala macrosclerotiorum]
MYQLEEQNGDLEDRIESLGGGKYDLENRLEKLEEGEESKVKLLAWPEEFQRGVNLKTTWPRRHRSGYTKVKVLLVSWESDDLNVIDEVGTLRDVFKDYYHFETSRYSIPDNQSTRALQAQVHQFIGDNSSETLLIFYYSGHGGIGDFRRDLLWSPTSRYGGPAIPACAIQTLFEDSASDSLLIYDACESADTAVIPAGDHPRGITELISACGYQTTAPGPGVDSLAFTLAEELHDAAIAGHPFSVSQLFSKILLRLRNSSEQGSKTTPVHTELTSDPGGRRIMLQPLQKSPSESRRDDGAETPHRALFLKFQNCTRINPKKWREWLLQAPPGVLEICFHQPTKKRENDRYGYGCLESDEGYQSRNDSSPHVNAGIKQDLKTEDDGPKVKHEPIVKMEDLYNS